MGNLVFLEPNRLDAVPFTTSDVIAEWTGNSYRSVQRIIEKQLTRLEKFGRVRFEITPLQTKGGIQDHKVYQLNEQQAILLITFLKNTDIVADFKVMVGDLRHQEGLADFRRSGKDVRSCIEQVLNHRRLALEHIVHQLV